MLAKLAATRGWKMMTSQTHPRQASFMEEPDSLPIAPVFSLEVLFIAGIVLCTIALLSILNWVGLGL